MHKITIMQFTKFSLVGLFNTAVTFGIYSILLEFVTYKISFILAFLVGLIFSFLFNSFFVFRNRINLRKFILFSYIPSIQFVVSFFSIDLLIVHLNISPKIAPILSLIILFPMSFFINKKILGQKISH